ncbi:uncharacterized protein FFB14_15839 [Fusarium fujikuroi]
MLSFG